MTNGQIVSSKVIEKLKEVLSDENYGYAAAVVTYCETKGLDQNIQGMAEFRDALTHVKRAIDCGDEQSALDELNSTYEHIRRAAVESMQEYVETRYAEIRRRVYLSRLKSIFARYKRPNKKDITNAEQIIKENIYKGREAKPRKAWQEAIGYFKRAEDELDKLDMIVPAQEELDYRYSEMVQEIVFFIAGAALGIGISLM